MFPQANKQTSEHGYGQANGKQCCTNEFCLHDKEKYDQNV